MQDRPDKTTLLQAAARFLLKDLQPRVAEQDKALGFRVLIAANLLSIVAAEVRAEEAEDEAQLRRLGALLPDLVPAALPERTSERQKLLRALEAALCERLRSNSLTGPARQAAWAHVKQTLKEKLAVVNPRFDTSDQIIEIE